MSRKELALIGRWEERREGLLERYELTWLVDEEMPKRSKVTVSQPSPGGLVNTAYVREMVRELAKRAAVERRVAPHQFRHALAVSLAREKVPMHLIQRQLGHSNLGTTATYLQGIAPFEVIDVMTARIAPEGTS